jgi:hypothetical protein
LISRKNTKKVSLTRYMGHDREQDSKLHAPLPYMLIRVSMCIKPITQQSFELKPQGCGVCIWSYRSCLWVVGPFPALLLL